MGRENVALFAFNRGLISKYALARTDIKRSALSASIMTNWMPRVLGSMMLRPGLGYLGATLTNAFAITIPFIFSSTDTGRLEMTDSVMRVWVSDALVSRSSVATAISNGTFASLVNWTSIDGIGAASANTGSKLNLTGTGYNAAGRYQAVTVAAPDQNVQHALRIVVERGPVTLRVGSTVGGDEYIAETILKTGTHSLTLTPTGNFNVQLSSTSRAVKLVTSVAIEAAGVLQLPTPWVLANLTLLRWDQSGDVVFVDCAGLQQYRIERRNGNSWSVVKYAPDDGPFRIQNVGPIRLTPSAANGNITIAASAPLFKTTQVGGLFRLTSEGQSVSQLLAGADQYTDTVRIVGVGTASRTLTVVISGVYVGTLTLERSFDNGTSWAKVTTYTGTGTSTYNDSAAPDLLVNVIALYRVGFIGSDYTSGSATLALSNPGGGITGIARITAFTSNVLVSAEVLKSLGGTNATANWSEGDWSDYRGWPSSTSLYEGRLNHSGRNKFWGSVSDGFESFDDTVIGDSGPISRSIGRGPVDTINWMLPLVRLVLGAQGAEISARSSSLDEPLTPTNFNLKPSSTQGSSAVPAVAVDNDGFFVQKSGTRVFRLSPDNYYFNYTAENQSQMIPELFLPGIVRLAVQRQPDTRIHTVLADGTVAILVFDSVENVSCWCLFQTQGSVEDVVILPDTIEDAVYYTIKRTVNGSTVRYFEKWAQEQNAIGGTVNRQGDAFIVYSGAPTTTITGLGHLEAKAVIVWADGLDFSADDASGVQRTYTVTGGQITLDTAVSHAMVGLPYTAQWQSSKLAYAAQAGTALTQMKIIHQVGVVLADAHALGLKVGQDFDHLDDLPLVRDNGSTIDITSVMSAEDVEAFPVNGTWDTDSRLCLQAKAPRPVNVIAAVMAISEVDKI